MHIRKLDINVADDAYEITHEGARLTFIIGNMDFPSEYNKKTRGEIWYTEVPSSKRKKGIGLAMCRKALSLMKAAGTKTVNMNPVTDEGKALIVSLIHNGEISKPIKQSATGKMEFKIV
jgi:predicted GNAT family acetyltransferase